MAIIEKSGFSLHPAGVFQAQVTTVTPAQSVNPDWPAQFRVDFMTTATDEDDSRMTIPYWVSQKLTDQNKLGRLAKALGFDVLSMSKGYPFDTDDMVGCCCKLVIEHQRRTDGSDRAKVVSVSVADARDSVPF